jgi:pyridoxine 5-phosphate synthase
MSFYPPTALSVNLNKVALVRNTRDGQVPSVLRAAKLCLQAGCHGITVHPRPDGRHIRPADVLALAGLLHAHNAGQANAHPVEFNIEGNPFDNLMPLVRSVRPQQCTFVPDGPDQRTSDHGWDMTRDAARLAPCVAEARALGVRVSLFIDPQPAAAAAATMSAIKALGADRVELYTEAYARAFGTPQQDSVLAQYAATAQAALDAGLGVNAGHDLNLANLAQFVAAVPGVAEVSIGHALIADALELGYAAAVRAYLACLV